MSAPPIPIPIPSIPIPVASDISNVPAAVSSPAVRAGTPGMSFPRIVIPALTPAAATPLPVPISITPAKVPTPSLSVPPVAPLPMIPNLPVLTSAPAAPLPAAVAISAPTAAPVAGPTTQMIRMAPASGMPPVMPGQCVVGYTEPAPRESQKPHVERLKVCWTERYFYIDRSVMGAGKTHMFSYLAKYYNFKYIVVVCPASGEDVWKEAQRMYGLPIVVITSYESLRSIKNSQPKHGLLRRVDSVSAEGVADTTFHPTPAFLQMVREGVVLLADEFHRVKNKTSVQHDAFKALALAVADNPGSSRVALMSGTPFDKKEQVINMLQMLGVIRHHRLYTYHKDIASLELQGAQEVVNFARSINSAATDEVLEEIPFTKSTVVDVCFELFIRVIQHSVASAAPAPQIGVDLDIKNAFYNMSPECTLALEAATGALRRAARFDARTGQVDQRDSDWGGITNALTAIELAEAETFIYRAHEVLAANYRPGANQTKVCLAFNFNQGLELSATALSGYNPIILNGSVKKEKRAALIAQFQSSDMRFPLLICNMAVVENSIQLDDQVGDRKRKVFASMNYFAMRIHQFTRRFYREQTKSSPEVIFVNGKCGAEKVSILNALARKKDVMTKTLEEQVEDGVIFPGEYPKWVEPDTDTPIQTLGLVPPPRNLDQVAASALGAVNLSAPPTPQPVLAMPRQNFVAAEAPLPLASPLPSATPTADPLASLLSIGAALPTIPGLPVIPALPRLP